MASTSNPLVSSIVRAFIVNHVLYPYLAVLVFALILFRSSVPISTLITNPVSLNVLDSLLNLIRSSISDSTLLCIIRPLASNVLASTTSSKVRYKYPSSTSSPNAIRVGLD